MNFCTGCGSRLADEAAFCAACGLQRVGPAAPPQVQYAPVGYQPYAYGAPGWPVASSRPGGVVLVLGIVVTICSVLQLYFLRYANAAWHGNQFICSSGGHIDCGGHLEAARVVTLASFVCTFGAIASAVVALARQRFGSRPWWAFVLIASVASCISSVVAGRLRFDGSPFLHWSLWQIREVVGLGPADRFGARVTGIGHAVAVIGLAGMLLCIVLVMMSGRREGES